MSVLIVGCGGDVHSGSPAATGGQASPDYGPIPMGGSVGIDSGRPTETGGVFLGFYGPPRVELTGGSSGSPGGTTSLGAGGMMALGGKVATGGGNNTGGTLATGGVPVTGGTNARGGTLAAGGLLATGGTNDDGGSSTSMFGCGDQSCLAYAQYCVVSISDVGGEPNAYFCVPLPQSCLNQLEPPSCDCIAEISCGACNTGSNPGELTDTCPGG